MPKYRKPKRKTPVTSPAGPSGRPQASGASSRPQATRTTIRRFHVLIKRQAQLQHIIQHQSGTGHAASADAELEGVERQILDLGGLPAYQRMSTIGQGEDRGGGSEKALMSWLRDLRLHEVQSTTKGKEKETEMHTRLRLLEVGALKPDNYAPCQAWLDVTPIDLHSQHPSILEQDFLLMDPEGHRGHWDVISLSLVLNFVPAAKDRGQMLRLAHTMLRHNGLLFIALPLPCVFNSRYLTPEHFHGLMSAVGFEQIRSRWKEGGKMAYWLFRRINTAASTSYQDHLYEKKTVFRQGDRNNFVILL